MDKFAQLTSAAKDAAIPTLEQARSGNYKKGRLELYGLKLAIETMAGQRRVGKTDGTPWSVICMAHYGDISGTKGADGDPLDVFVGPWPESDRAYVVNRHGPSGRFDEHKILLAFPDASSAVNAYKNSYERGQDGLRSVVPCSIEQLKWWIKFGDHSVPLTANSLPHDGSVDMNETAWDANAQPVGTDLPSLMYRLRREDAGSGLLLDSVTVTDILEDSDGELALDALVIPFNRLERKMTQMQLAMKVAGDSVKPVAMQITPPFKQRGTTNVAVVYELSDGQTLSVYFHNPDTTPNKLTPDDEMVSWKWLLNKKDVTILVAPERGSDLNPREVARRIMRLAERNSARFQSANEKRAERMASIEAMRTGIDAKVAQLNELTKEIETLEARVAEKRADHVPAGSLKGKSDSSLSRTASWVIKNKLTGEIVMETFDQKKVDALNTEKYVAVPILEHLQGLNNQPAATLQGESRDVTGEAVAGVNTEADQGQTVVQEQGTDSGFDGRAGDVMEELAKLGWNAKRGNLNASKEFNGSVYGIRANYTIVGNKYTALNFADTGGGETSVEDDLSMPPAEVAAAIDSQMRDSIKRARVEVYGPTSAEGYAIVSADEDLQIRHQDELDSFFQQRLVAVRNAMRDLGWFGPEKVMTKGGYRFTFDVASVGAGANVVGLKYQILDAKEVEVTGLVDDLTKTPEQIAAELDAVAAPASDASRSAEDMSTLHEIRMFLSQGQKEAIAEGLKGEEVSYFREKLSEIANTIKTMPETYGQDGKGDQAIAYLHYFKGAGDWYITEKDAEGGVDQAFGLANLGQGAELGYISIRELTRAGVELDLHWKPKTIAAINGGDSDAEVVAAAVEADALAGLRVSASKLATAWDAGVAKAEEPGQRALYGFDALIKEALNNSGSLTANRLTRYLADELVNGQMPGYAFADAVKRINEVAGKMADQYSSEMPPEPKPTPTTAQGYNKAGGDITEAKIETIALAFPMMALQDALYAAPDMTLSNAVTELQKRFDKAAQEYFDLANSKVADEEKAKDDADQAQFSPFDRASLKTPTAAQLGFGKMNTVALFELDGEKGWTNGHIVDLSRPKLVNDGIVKYYVDETSQSLRQIGADKVEALINRMKSGATIKVEPIANWDSILIDNASMARAASRAASGNYKAAKAEQTKVPAVVLASADQVVGVPVDRRYLGYFDRLYKQPDYFTDSTGSTVIVKKAGKLV